MSLWSIVSASQMQQASQSSRFVILPTPYQLSIMIGLCLASMEQLRAYLYYICRRKRKIRTPPVLDKAAFVMLMALTLAAAVFISDTVLHYLTTTVVFDRISAVDTEQHNYGRALSKLCLDLDRVKENSGFPCSLPVGPNFTDPEATENYNEISRLQSNESTISQIRHAKAAEVEVNVAIVLPHPTTVDISNDYRASTVGVATTCQLLQPSLCNMRSVGTLHTMTAFNCSDCFFGLLGKAPNTTATNDGSKPLDDDVSPLSFKSSPNLQFAFFTNDNLSTIYNPEAWNPDTNIPDMQNGLPDALLLNPIQVAFAVQAYTSLFSAGSEMLTSDSVFKNSENIAAFIVSCSITTYEVDYVWHRSLLRSAKATKSPNGTLLEVFHGNQVYSTIAGGFDLQSNLVSASLAGPKISDYLGKWQDLYSVKVLSHIGGHLSSQVTAQEQHREQILVAQVPKSTLGALIGSSLLYSLVGLVLVIMTYRARNARTSAIADQLSLAGLTNMAFGDGKEKDHSGNATPYTAVSKTTGGTNLLTVNTTQKESRRVRIDGTEFQVWV